MCAHWVWVYHFFGFPPADRSLSPFEYIDEKWKFNAYIRAMDEYPRIPGKMPWKYWWKQYFHYNDYFQGVLTRDSNLIFSVRVLTKYLFPCLLCGMAYGYGVIMHPHHSKHRKNKRYIAEIHRGAYLAHTTEHKTIMQMVNVNILLYNYVYN